MYVLIFLICLIFVSFAYKFIYRCYYPIKYKEFVDKASRIYDVEKSLIYAIIKCESNFNKNANSCAGAVGLMQITPDTFDWLKFYSKEDKESVEMLNDPEINIMYGTLFISILKNKYSDMGVVLSAYNAGIKQVNRWLRDDKNSLDRRSLNYIPYKETREYVRRVKIAEKNYKRIYISGEM